MRSHLRSTLHKGLSEYSFRRYSALFCHKNHSMCIFPKQWVIIRHFLQPGISGKIQDRLFCQSGPDSGFFKGWEIISPNTDLHYLKTGLLLKITAHDWSNLRAAIRKVLLASYSEQFPAIFRHSDQIPCISHNNRAAILWLRAVFKIQTGNRSPI